MFPRERQGVWARGLACVCVYVCVSVRTSLLACVLSARVRVPVGARMRVREPVWVCARASEQVCVRACVRACVRMSVCAFVCMILRACVCVRMRVRMHLRVRLRARPRARLRGSASKCLLGFHSVRKSRSVFQVRFLLRFLGVVFLDVSFGFPGETKQHARAKYRLELTCAHAHVRTCTGVRALVLRTGDVSEWCVCVRVWRGCAFVCMCVCV